MTTQVHVHLHAGRSVGRLRSGEQRTLARRLMWPSMLGRMFRVRGPRNSTLVHAPVAAVAYSVAMFTWVFFAAPTISLLVLMFSWMMLACWGMCLGAYWLVVAMGRGALWVWHRGREIATAHTVNR